MNEHAATIREALDLFVLFVNTTDQEAIPTYDQLHDAAIPALAALDALEAERDQRWPDEAFQRVANDLVTACIRAEDERQRADRAESLLARKDEALREIAGHTIVSETTVPDDLCDWHCTVTLVGIAKDALAGEDEA